MEVEGPSQGSWICYEKMLYREREDVPFIEGAIESESK